MPYFPLITFQEMVLALFFGLGVLGLLYLAWAGYPEEPAGREEKGSEERGSPESVGERQSVSNSVPPFLILTYVVVVVWALAYFIFVGLQGGAIG
jgi:hypothetical protein